MPSRAPYHVIALDSDGSELARTDDCSSLKTAQGFAALYFEDKELRSAGMHKVEIINMHGTCEWDAFVA